MINSNLLEKIIVSSSRHYLYHLRVLLALSLSDAIMETRGPLAVTRTLRVAGMPALGDLYASPIDRGDMSEATYLRWLNGDFT